MQNLLIKYIFLLGTAVCHQIPARSFFSGSNQICVCSRCEGIYIGFLISTIILFIMFRKKQSELPPLYIIIIISIFILSTIIDGIISHFYLLETNNYARFITGYLAGGASSILIYPIFNYQYYYNSIDEKIFNKPSNFLIFFLISCIFIYFGISKIFLVNLIYFYLSPIAIIFTFFAINFLIVLLIPLFSRKADKFFSKFLIFPSIIALIFSIIELFISYKFHIFIATRYS